MKQLIVTAFFSLALGGALCAQHDHQHPAPAADAAKSSYKVVDVYPITTCIVSGEKLDAKKQVATTANGRTFQVCSEECAKKLAAAPEEYSGKLDAKIIAEQSPFYALTTCPISNEKIEDGKGKFKVIDGVMAHFCCSKCVGKAEANKVAVLQKVRDAAYQAQSKAWKLEKCPATDDKLKAGDTVDVMVGMRFARLCCEDCVDEIKKDPAKFFAKLPAATGKGAGKEGSGECCSDGAKKTEACCATEEPKDAKKDPQPEKKAKNDKQ